MPIVTKYAFLVELGEDEYMPYGWFHEPSNNPLDTGGHWESLSVVSYPLKKASEIAERHHLDTVEDYELWAAINEIEE